MAAFKDLKEAFTDIADILYHFNSSKVLYVFLDALKELGFSVTACQLNGAVIRDDLKPIRTLLQLIIFLLKCLTPAKRNYWPIDLELIGLI